ncbi:MAG: polysaccharide deacetylase family protein [Paludibacteraceae bacterium]|nr:polysaccharide deacetylase family protein [Paludibacteraceae bacterium]
MEELIRYLINFLIDSPLHSNLSSTIGYTRDTTLFSSYKIVIIPSPFFNNDIYGKSESLPTLPLKKIDDTPILYGEPTFENIEGTLVVHADLLASAYFMLTRYEEWIRTDCRDIHGRFPGKESIAYKENFIHRPIVDEYGKLLRKWLREKGVAIDEPEPQIAKIYLTHDVDQPCLHRTWRGLAGACRRSLKNRNTEFITAIKTFLGDVYSDKLFTFPWIFEHDKDFRQKTAIPTEAIFFFKSAKIGSEQDNPCYSLVSDDIQLLFRLCKKEDSIIGLHNSYLSGKKHSLVLLEKKLLEQYSGQTIRYNRYHYLRSMNPMDMEYLVEANLTDDFTLGYADVAGFRLGTCKAVNWINPATKKISNLHLHPLTIMDVSLSAERYMNLNQEDAFTYATKLIDRVKEHHGELVLLWHNTSLAGEPRINQKKLYTDLLKYINA